MYIKIKNSDECLDLGADFSMTIEEKSPLMNDRGSQSLPLTVPMTRRNARLTGFPHRPDMGVGVMNGDTRCVVSDGAVNRTGKVHVTGADSEGVTMNIGFDNSEAYSKWNQKKLRELTCPTRNYGSASALVRSMNSTLRGNQDDFVVLRVVVSNTYAADGGIDMRVLNWLNETKANGDLNGDARPMYIDIDGRRTQIQVPEGYGVTAFIRVWRLLEIIFGNFGYTVVENPFKSGPLSAVIVLNNTADMCVTGTLDYRDMMPDGTVEQLLKTLYVRFGMVYTLDGSRMEAHVRLIRDILQQPSLLKLDSRLQVFPSVSFSEPRQLKLSAKTSLEGAAPLQERFEDFISGYENVAEVVNTFAPGSSHTAVVYEKSTGRWYKWDATNAEYVRGSSHYCWDRSTPGVDNEELTSDDECVATAVIPEILPYWAVGYVHRHTYIKTQNVDDKSGDNTTPISLLLALPGFDTVGSSVSVVGGAVSPVKSDGTRAQWGGEDFPFSLLWQFRDGLFAQFWKDYDAVLRHAWNEVSAEAVFRAAELGDVDLLNPVSLFGQHMLIDGMSYRLPGGSRRSVSLKLRSLHLIGPYDLEAEQHVGTVDGVWWRWVPTVIGLEEAKAEAEAWVKKNVKEGLEVYVRILTGTYVTQGYTWYEDDAEIKSRVPQTAGETYTKNYTVGYKMDYRAYTPYYDPRDGTSTRVLAYTVRWTAEGI